VTTRQGNKKRPKGAKNQQPRGVGPRGDYFIGRNFGLTRR
jgi:hypothetical protein